MPEELQFIPNNIGAFEQGALYPGGSGVVKELRYKLWDYDGNRPPDSQVAAYLLFAPADGSNEGKDVEVYWSVGPSSDFVIDPEGGRLMSHPQKSRTGQSASSNFGFVMGKFKDNCGFSDSDQSKYLNGPRGIRIMEGADLTLASVDQPKREGLEQDEATKAKEAKYGPRKILVPTRVRWPWEKKGAAKSTSASVPTQAAAAGGSSAASKATMGQTQHPPATENGAGPVSLSSALKVLLESAPDNTLSVDEIPAKLLESLNDIPRGERAAILKESKTDGAIAAAAKTNGWVYNGKELMAV